MFLTAVTGPKYPEMTENQKERLKSTCPERHIPKGSLRGSIECQSQPSTETPTELGFIYREREKAGTTGRDTATIEQYKGVQGFVPAAGLSAHLTISHHQTSGSQLSQEKLAALSKPLDEADIAPVGLIRYNLDINQGALGPSQSCWIRHHSGTADKVKFSWAAGSV
ncbi:hypothetical protein HO173_003922 [Letharia columbiana]|uniref:Uncharacterized protein n=1 Tax=Letharia columbiana TaxID=112416 RepID=A0A8H6FZT0_9LECA|nr:uncharacterized protein HO173_003922 [Letharia columbiana]KAF6237721.1 hypothetical protein HO173_003922 [Letharia columbiana]